MSFDNVRCLSRPEFTCQTTQYLALINVFIFESVNLDEAGMVGDHSRFLI